MKVISKYIILLAIILIVFKCSIFYQDEVHTRKGNYIVLFDTLNATISKYSGYLEGVIHENSPGQGNPIMYYASISNKELDTVLYTNDIGYFKIKCHFGIYI